VYELASRTPIIRLLDNPGRLQAIGMNVGLKAARGRTIVRLDAHSTYPAGHVERCCDALERSDAANVGGVMVPVGSGIVQETVARAMAHPAGIGGSKFHLENFSGYVDTAYLGTFRRDILDKLGGYDPAAHPTEDAELNCRIIALGERVYLDNSIRIEYRPRDTFGRLMKQFFWYGRGRCYVILKHRRVFTAARFAPPLLVISLVATLLLGALDRRWLFMPIAYVVALLVVAGWMWWGERDWLRRTLVQAGVLGTMHISYGTGFLLKLVHVLR
jgi:glycosyltransferase involved in cell wall biosynthesis